MENDIVEVDEAYIELKGIVRLALSKKNNTSTQKNSASYICMCRLYKYRRSVLFQFDSVKKSAA